MAWGGLEEQRKEQEAGNSHAKNWCNEALNIMKKTMQDYWDSNPAADPPAHMETNISALEDNNTLESKFDRHCRSMITQNIGSGGEGWATELHHYLDDLPSDVTKDTNIIEWWVVSTNSLMFCMSLTIVQNHTNSYPMLARIAKDVCAVPATSVPCEHLFSGGGAKIATDRRSQLGADKFEHLQVLKHLWHSNVIDRATINLQDVEVQLEEFKELLAHESAMEHKLDTSDTIPMD